MNTMEDLTDQDFKALIRLLDDEDPEISEHVWGRIMALGAAAKERLEAEWEIEEDPAIQARLEDAIHKINLSTATRELREWRLGGGKDLLEGWFLVSKFEFPELDFRKHRNEVNRLVNKTWLELNDRMDPVQKIKVINHILFQMEGYGPNKNRPHFPKANFINEVTGTQEGNAVSLGLLYLIICQQLNLNVFGVILPGYFILMFKDDKEEFYIDVYNGGHPFNRAALEGYLKQVGVEQKASYFSPTSNIYMVLNLIRTAIHDYQQQGQAQKVAELEDLLRDIDIRFEP
jgi:regulator of sirC expression with transglutaminase-like and TPR domain